MGDSWLSQNPLSIPLWFNNYIFKKMCSYYFNFQSNCWQFQKWFESFYSVRILGRVWLIVLWLYLVVQSFSSPLPDLSFSWLQGTATLAPIRQGASPSKCAALRRSLRARLRNFCRLRSRRPSRRARSRRRLVAAANGSWLRRGRRNRRTCRPTTLRTITSTWTRYHPLQCFMLWAKLCHLTLFPCFTVTIATKYHSFSLIQLSGTWCIFIPVLNS